MSSTKQADFGRLRSLLWPIYRHELSLTVPMCLMAFFICLNYTLLRNLKDALIVTANSSAEVLPFIKVWAMLPVAFLMTFILTKLSNRYSQERIFYLITSGFLGFYALFLFVLYPLRDILHPTVFADRLTEILPLGCKGFVAMLRNWTFTSLYVMSELWSVMILTVLFWGLANEVTKVGESHRFYAVFNVASNLGSIVAGQVPWMIVSYTQEEAIQILLTTVLVSGLLMMLIFRFMNKSVLAGPQFATLHTTRTEQRNSSKKKLSLLESFIYVAKSPYLFYVAALVVGYNLVLHITEVLWKDSLQHLYPAFNDYNVYLGGLTTTISLVSMLISFCIPKMLQKGGWTLTALITPICMSMTCALFFMFLLFPNSPVLNSIFLGISPLTVLVITGAMQNVTCRACKYSVFDATKEMALIPLEHDHKMKGKAAIDGVGSRLGKSGGALLIQIFILLSGSLTRSIPCLGMLLFIVLGCWIYSVYKLGVEFNRLTDPAASQENKPVPREEELSQVATA